MSERTMAGVAPARVGGSLDVGRLRAALTRGRRRRAGVTVAALVVLAALAVTIMCVGDSVYAPLTVLSVLAGAPADDVLARAVWDYRLPRLVAGVLVGAGFGVAGNSFQTMLRNPLASPDVIGITTGSSVAAVFCILMLGMGAGAASLVAMAAALAIAAAIYGLANVGGFSTGKLILVGLGFQALGRACISFLLLKGAEFDVPTALRWLSGSLNGVTLAEIAPLLAIIPLAVLAVALGSRLRALELGDEFATTLGARPGLTRALLIVACVLMIAIGTSVTGPIACVTFLAGPIASRVVGERSSATVAAGLVGAILVLASELVGQELLGTRFPVGVVTGLLGTPYLLWLLVRMNKKGSL